MQFPTWTVPQGKLDDLALDERVYQVRRYFHLHLLVYLDSSIHHGMGLGSLGCWAFSIHVHCLILPAGNSQETKRLVAAEMQHITYNEFLPAVLVPANNCSLYSLSLSRVTLKWQAMGWTMRIASLGKRESFFVQHFFYWLKNLFVLHFISVKVWILASSTVLPLQRIDLDTALSRAYSGLPTSFKFQFLNLIYMKI